MTCAICGRTLPAKVRPGRRAEVCAGDGAPSDCRRLLDLASEIERVAGRLPATKGRRVAEVAKRLNRVRMRLQRAAGEQP